MSNLIDQSTKEMEKSLPPLSHLHKFIQDGIKRVQSVIGSDEFTFHVNGSRFGSTVIEAVFISPAVEQLLTSDFGTREFVITDEDIVSTDFSVLFGFFRSACGSSSCSDSTLNSSSKSFSSQKSLLSICRYLGNENLELMALTSSEQLFRMSQFRDAEMDVVKCASEFYSYSTPDILELSIDTLNDILSNRSLRIIDEDWLLNLLLGFGSISQYSFLFGHIRFEFLSAEGISQFCDSFGYVNLTEDVWTGITRRLRGSIDNEFRQGRCFRACVHGFESQICSEFPTLLNEFRSRRMKLLYRGSQDGFGSSDFHRKCDGQTDTITFIQTTKDFIFGGYTPIAWDSSDSYKPDSSQKSFVFTLTNPHSIGSRRFALKPDHLNYAICASPSYGPIFGNGNTICVCDKCNSCNSSYTRLYAYVNDTGLDE
jgi:hypothetical protein